MSVWHDALEIVSTGEACVLVTIVQTAGSSPREAGAQMLVTVERQLGSIGGGNLEYIVTGQARALLASTEFFRVQSYPLGPLLAQCCGGRVRVLLERLDSDQRDVLSAIATAQSLGTRLQTMSEDGRIHHRLLFAHHGGVALMDSEGRLANIQEPLESGFVFEQPLPSPEPPLYVFGAGHVGQAVVRIAARLPLSTKWFDERSELSLEPDVGLEVDHSDWRAAIATAPSDALYLIVSHSHTLDYALARAILGRGDFRYCGLIGSKTKRARFDKRLLADGVAPEALRRLKCPVGAIGLSSKQPEVIAVAIAAELLLEIQNTSATRGGMVGDVGIEPTTR